MIERRIIRIERQIKFEIQHFLHQKRFLDFYRYRQSSSIVNVIPIKYLANKN